MEREIDDDGDKVEREIEDDPDEQPVETEIENSRGSDALRNVNPLPARNRAEAVYGDTDMDPNRDDQRSAHHAEPDEHL